MTNKQIDWTDLDEFTTSYLETALWSSMDDDGDPLDLQYGIEDFAPEAIQQAFEDCTAFQADNMGWLARAGTDAQNGHDFWLTRNRHGAGFWDHGYPEDVDDGLTDAAHAYGSCDLYEGDPDDDGERLIYME